MITKGTTLETTNGSFTFSTWVNRVEDGISNTSGTDFSELKVEVNEIKSTVGSHDGRISTVQQTADKINWVVASGSSSSNFTITDRMATLTANQINLKGLVAFSGLDSNTRTTINNASTDASSAKSTANTANTNASAAKTAANEAKSTANTANTNASAAKTKADSNAGVIADWCYNNDKTFIDGGNIYTGTITAIKIAAGAVTADKIAAGAVTADKLSVTSLESICANIGGFNISGNALVTANNKSSEICLKVNNSSTYEKTIVSIGDSGELAEILATSAPFYINRAYNLANEYFSYIGIEDGEIHIKKTHYVNKHMDEYGNLTAPTTITACDSNNMLIISYDGIYRPGQPDNALQFKNDFEFNTAYANITIGTPEKPSGDHYLKIDHYIYASDLGTTYRLIGASSSGNVIVGFKTKNANSVKIQAGYQKDITFDIATNTDGTTSSEVFKVFYDTKQKKYIFRSPLIHNYTSSSANQVGVDQYGSLSRYPSSSKRYKEDISEKLSSNVDPHGLYNLPVVEYVYKDGYLSENDLRYGQKFIGFIAEDVEKTYPLAANYNSDGLVENWEPNIIIPGMLKLVQEQHTQIDYISRRMDTNEEKIEALQNQLAEAMITIAFQQKQIDILQAAS